MADKQSGPGETELFALLLEKKLLSSAQVEVAKIDIAATGMNAIDVLLARKWIKEDDLPNFSSSSAPVSQKPGSSSATAAGSSSAGSMPNSSTNSVVSNSKAGSSQQKVAADTSASNSEQTYLENLKKYRQLMAKIMGEAG